jgi:hypothetical protein
MHYSLYSDTRGVTTYVLKAVRGVWITPVSDKLCLKNPDMTTDWYSCSPTEFSDPPFYYISPLSQNYIKNTNLFLQYDYKS